MCYKVCTKKIHLLNFLPVFWKKVEDCDSLNSSHYFPVDPLKYLAREPTQKMLNILIELYIVQGNNVTRSIQVIAMLQECQNSSASLLRHLTHWSTENWWKALVSNVSRWDPFEAHQLRSLARANSVRCTISSSPSFLGRISIWKIKIPNQRRSRVRETKSY